MTNNDATISRSSRIMIEKENGDIVELLGHEIVIRKIGGKTTLQLITKDHKVIIPDEKAIAEVLLQLCGKGKALHNHQMWLGPCCMLRGNNNFPWGIEQCCEYIVNLPFESRPKYECKYENIRKFKHYKFVNIEIDEWDEYKPNPEEEKLFYGCLNVVRALRKSFSNIPDKMK